MSEAIHATSVAVTRSSPSSGSWTWMIGRWWFLRPTRPTDGAGSCRDSPTRAGHETHQAQPKTLTRQNGQPNNTSQNASRPKPLHQANNPSGNHHPRRWVLRHSPRMPTRRRPKGPGGGQFAPSTPPEQIVSDVPLTVDASRYETPREELLERYSAGERRFTDSRLPGIDLPGAYLRKVDFTTAHLPGANFKGADFRGASLHGAWCPGVDCSGVDFTDAELLWLYAPGGDFSGADFSGADLRSANLRGADLREANLATADCVGADFAGANLKGAALPESADVDESA